MTRKKTEPTPAQPAIKYGHRTIGNAADGLELGMRMQNALAPIQAEFTVEAVCETLVGNYVARAIVDGRTDAEIVKLVRDSVGALRTSMPAISRYTAQLGEEMDRVATKLPGGSRTRASKAGRVKALKDGAMSAGPRVRSKKKGKSP